MKYQKGEKSLKKKSKFHAVSKIISGSGSLKNIPSELAQLGASRPLVITDKAYKGSGAEKKITKSFRKPNCTPVSIHIEAENKTSLDEIIRITGLYRWKSCDSIIAIGSATAMDTARGVNIIVSTGNENIVQFAGKEKIPNKLKPMVAVPLPVLRGNETSNMALINGVKYISGYLYPDIIASDPKLSALASKHSILESALSILSLSLDSAMLQKGDPERNTYLFKALNLICSNLETMHEKPGNKKIKTALVEAGAITGAACDSSNPGFITSAGLAISEETGLPFGTAAGIIMPHAIEYSYEHHGPHDSGILLAVAGKKIFDITPEKQRGEVTAVMIESWINGIGSRIPKNLNKIKFPESRIRAVSDIAEKLSGGIYKSREFFSVFTTAMTGKIKTKEKDKMSFDLNKIINNTFGIEK